MDEERMMVLVNMHWKPVYVNCGPCRQRSARTLSYLELIFPLVVRYDLIMKMETLTRDSQYLKVNYTLATQYLHPPTL